LEKKSIDPIESSTLVIENTAMKASDQSNKTHDKPRVWYDHCNKPRHTRETCWKVHGKPANWKSAKQFERNSH